MEWNECSKMCSIGIQQRFRNCLLHQQNNETVREHSKSNSTKDSSGIASENDKSDATISQPENESFQQKCDSYNIEQRECNFFECASKNAFL